MTPYDLCLVTFLHLMVAFSVPLFAGTILALFFYVLQKLLMLSTCCFPQQTNYFEFEMSCVIISDFLFGCHAAQYKVQGERHTLSAVVEWPTFLQEGNKTNHMLSMTGYRLL